MHVCWYKLCKLAYIMYVKAILYTEILCILILIYKHLLSIQTQYTVCREELLVPGGLVLGLTTSIASRDLHEVDTRIVYVYMMYACI